MNSIDLFLVQYGLAAIFLIMFIKSMGVPIPIPGDLIILTAAARVAQGKLVLWQVFVAIFIAMVLGGLIQFVLARGPGRGLLYRLGRYIGLTPPRLNAAAEKVKKGGVLGISLAILVPGVRGAAVVASGLVDLPLMTFLPGLAIGTILFLGLHFFLGYLGGLALSIIGRVLPLPLFVILLLMLLVIIYALWVVVSHWRKAARAELDAAQKAASVEVWHEGICPVCLALYTANQLRTYTAD